MPKLSDYFERIYIINLPYRPDRRERIERHLDELGLAGPGEITWVKAISGDMCWPPSWFKAGGGAWGCLQTHLRLVQEAIMDGIGNYLVLEDDAVFHARAPDHLQLLMDELPPDWGQLYLGGQHLQKPQAVDGTSFVLRGSCINRTHAFALHRRAMAIFQQHIANAPDYIERAPWHVDHQLGIAHERRDWKVYTPAWWLAGQDDGGSNISGRANPRMWWFPPGFSSGLPFIYLSPDQEAELAAQVREAVHFGNTLKPGTFEDAGLDACVGEQQELEKWLAMIAGEALDRGMLPGIRHAEITMEEAGACWPAGIRDAGGADFESLLNYPYNGLFAHPLNE
ncbi:glycosyltransferase family 25 protein [Luteolibacter sp. Populi]|uniref:glycosyltransferase family 25 protein n=1 Tax=Luteolibacter sp. Populi TaxID=3230487 RepID=UPI003466D621